MQRLTFITGNPNKAHFVSQWLQIDIDHHKLDLDEVQSLDLRTVVEHKARQAYDILKSPVLVEDATLSFTALGRLPGTFIKWFIEEIQVAGLCRLLDGYEDRSATGVICYALYDGETMHFFEGSMTGTIAQNPQGTGGFGFDAIFINDGYSVTRAEMDEESYKKTAYRYKALTKLSKHLRGE